MPSAWKHNLFTVLKWNRSKPTPRHRKESNLEGRRNQKPGITLMSDLKISQRYGKQDTHCTCNDILRRVRETIVTVEELYYIHCECVRGLKKPARNAPAPYSYLWYALIYNIFVHGLIARTNFQKTLFKWNVYFYILYTSARNISHSKTN
jgi:hypothetical protein